MSVIHLFGAPLTEENLKNLIRIDFKQHDEDGEDEETTVLIPLTKSGKIKKPKKQKAFSMNFQCV